MSQEITTLEVIALSVDEAIQRGLAQLGVERDAVEVEVLDAGSKGLFGIGSRQARVVLRVKLAEVTPKAAVKAPKKTEKVKTAESEDKSLAVSRQVVEDLLERMKITASVTSRYVDSPDEDGEKVIMVDIQGNDLSILIGKRSETLNALQYITSLIVGKELNHWTPVMIDIQGYRSRRERQLRQLARRMADQALQTGKRQVLEPMPASERRLIHMELREHPHVITESVGEEPNRKVTIVLKK